MARASAGVATLEREGLEDGSDDRELRIEPMKYLVEVFWSDDEGYIAVVPDLPGWSASGPTPEAAIHEIGDATLAWIAACRASGDPIPASTTKAPAARPDANSSEVLERKT